MTGGVSSLPLGVPVPFTVWAPLPGSISLVLQNPDPTAGERAEIAMERDPDDWWQPVEPLPGWALGEVDYGYSLDGGEPVADPRSLRQPNGVHALSRTYDSAAYRWGDRAWTGRQLAGGVIYELHVGTFTPEGTLTAAIDKLDHLVALGADFVEIMPVNAFNGVHNWGYDGVLWYAVHEQYGGPAAYQAFVDACHQRGLAVLQDVVYNHLGPSGNHLAAFGPYLHSASANPWGETVNLDGEDSDEVRRFIIENALLWLRDYHVDGLRLDAVHALTDTRATHVLEELAIEASALSVHLRRPLSLIAESDLNDPRLITRRDGGGYGLTAQWSDDFHHALYVGADRRHQRLLRRLRIAGLPGQGVRQRLLPRRHAFLVPRPVARQPDRHPPDPVLAAGGLRRQPRPDRQPGRRAPAGGRAEPGPAAAGRADHRAQPVHPDDLHGRGVGGLDPLAVLHLAPGAGPGRERTLRAVRGVRQDGLGSRHGARPPGPGDLPRFGPGLVGGRRGPHAELLSFTTEVLRLRRAHADFTDPRFGLGETTADDEEGTLLVDRGSVFFVVNFLDVPARAPLAGPVETLLTVGQAEHANEIVWLGPYSALVGSRTLRA